MDEPHTAQEQAPSAPTSVPSLTITFKLPEGADLGVTVANALHASTLEVLALNVGPYWTGH